MLKQSNSIKLIAIVLPVIGSIVIALITYQPWKNKDFHKEVINYSLSGTVIDESTGESLSSVDVSVVGLNSQCYTEQNGNFNLIFKDSITTARLRVSKKGFKLYDKTYDVPQRGIVIVLKKCD